MPAAQSTTGRADVTVVVVVVVVVVGVVGEE
jgi:hypothetical protein